MKQLLQVSGVLIQWYFAEETPSVTCEICAHETSASPKRFATKNANQQETAPARGGVLLARGEQFSLGFLGLFITFGVPLP